jgi:hypothetical protein
VNYDDEILMAYADGELDAARRAEIEAAIANDPELARRVEQHRALRGEISGAFAPVLVETVPERLVTAARAGVPSAAAPARGKVLQFPARTARPPATPWRGREWAAMAASLVLGVLLSWRLLAPQDSGVMVAGRDALLARGALAKALDGQLASAQQGDEAVLIGLTFKARDGNYCRTFMLRAANTAGLACRVGSDWQVPAVDSSVGTTGEVKQASSAVTPAILRALEARIDGEPLDADGEQTAKVSGWQDP